MLQLEPKALTWAYACELAPVIRKADLLECRNDPLGMFVYGMHSGDAWTCWHVNEDWRPPVEKLMGAYGYTDEGTIWALFRDLSLIESMAVLRHTRLWVRSLLAQSRQPWLYNFVHVDNEAAVGWLVATGCFDIQWRVERLEGTPAYYFRTRPELAA